ncbi:major facilitator superfamily domain-containing protein [Lipomyces oligophaga]|uniref:major facilitator superfamily domain-containing protein n=1 Tax=Lipomyces oligophaga TaxID=45792 RepID=UPI0034CE3B85
MTASLHSSEDFKRDDRESNILPVAPSEVELLSVKPLPEKRHWWSFFNEYEYRDLYERNGAGHKWYHWFDETDTPEERRYIIKLDLLITSYCFLSYWVKNLDQTNVNNAYVSGMSEELSLPSNALTKLQVMYNVGCVVFQLPFLYLFPKVRMDLLIPGLDIVWGLFTLAQYRAKSLREMMAYRFLIGCAEGPFFPGVHYVLGSWFKGHEIQRRGGIFYMGLMLGSCTAGLLQAAILRTLDGANGLAGWRWMFIIDAIITIPVGFIGFIIWPGTPDKLHSYFFTEQDAAIARRRAARSGVQKSAGFSWALVKKACSSWHLPVLSFWNFLFWNSSAQGYGVFLQWLKSLDRYSTSKLNDLSAIPPALGIAYVAIACFGADIFRSRWFFLCLPQFINWTNHVILATWNVPESAKWYSYMVEYNSNAMSSVLYGWINDIVRHDNEYRSVVLLIVNVIAQQSTAWTPLIFWNSSTAPSYHRGFIWGACVSATLICWTFVVLYFFKRDERRYYFQRWNAAQEQLADWQVRDLHSDDQGEVPPAEHDLADEIDEKSDLQHIIAVKP